MCAVQNRPASCLQCTEHETTPSLLTPTHPIHLTPFGVMSFMIQLSQTKSHFQVFVPSSPTLPFSLSLSPTLPLPPSRHLSDAQCTSNEGLFVPLVAALSFVVALWLCCTLCLIGGLCKVRSKRQCNRRGHGNQLQQANIPEEGLAVAPCPQEDRPCPSVVTEPLPSR